MVVSHLNLVWAFPFRSTYLQVFHVMQSEYELFYLWYRNVIKGVSK